MSTIPVKTPDSASVISMLGSSAAARPGDSARPAGPDGQPPDEIMPIRSDEQIVRLRRFVREKTVALGFSLIDQTKFVTAASELARNTLTYGGGGEVHFTCCSVTGASDCGSSSSTMAPAFRIFRRRCPMASPRATGWAWVWAAQSGYATSLKFVLRRAKALTSV